jgi:hypothetical protein
MIEKANDMTCALFVNHQLWFEISIVSMVFTLGHIFLGHFEERTPKWRKLLKFLISILIVCLVSVYGSRQIAMVLLGCMFIPVIYVHAYLLPSKGINGWTAEPQERYYAYRGWDKKEK